MILKYFHHGFNYSQDGPGNRLVYHLQGCNMHCPWCSNPEGMDINRTAKENDTDQIVNEIISCSPMFFDNGGVTFTGGEATLQLDAVYDIMKKVKSYGITTAVETNATQKGIEKLAGVCDYFMIDFKHPDNDKLKEITGVGNLQTKENIFKLIKLCHLSLRIPLIHNFNDNKKDLEGFIEFFTELSRISKDFDIELLPYHEYGKEKWDKCNKEYTVTDGFVSKQTLEEFTNKLKLNGFTVIKT